MDEFMNICPAESELATSIENYSCTENGCSSVFQKISNLQLHLVKHHNIGSLIPRPKGVVQRFFCPRLDCVYNINQTNNKSFAQKRLLKQHFMKVHAPKNYMCNKCGIQSSLVSVHKRHLKSCGMKFSCGACGWEYNSNESLLVHLLRKHPEIHQTYLQNKISSKKKVKNIVNPFRTCEKLNNVIPVLNSPVDNFDNQNKVFTKSNQIECDFTNIPPTNDSCMVHNIVKYEHNYTKSCDSREKTNYLLENKNISFVNLVKQPDDFKNKYQLVIPARNDPTHALIPIDLFNQDQFLKQQNLNNVKVLLKTNQSSISNQMGTSNLAKLAYVDQCTQTSLKLSKKSRYSKVDKTNVETQTFKQPWNVLPEKNKSKCRNLYSKSFDNQKNESQNTKTNPKVTKNKRKQQIVDINSDSNFETTNATSLNLTAEENRNSFSNSNFANENISTLNKHLIISETLKSSDKIGTLTNEDSYEDNNVIDEHSNVFLSNSILKTISNSNSMDFNCQFDCEDIATQSSDIETQTALDELLYSNTHKCDDLQDDIFSELIHLSDIQTQTTWPLSNCDIKKCLDIDINLIEDKSNAVLKSTETQTIETLDAENSLFSTYNYNIEKNSPLFEGTSSHFCFKETQTCFCYLNSLKCDEHFNSKIEINLSNNTHNSVNTINNFSTKDTCLLTSAETQTQFSFDHSQFFNRKSDVLLSCCTTETQTCFEDTYLDSVMELNQNKNI